MKAKQATVSCIGLLQGPIDFVSLTKIEQLIVSCCTSAQIVLDYFDGRGISHWRR